MLAMLTMWPGAHLATQCDGYICVRGDTSDTTRYQLSPTDRHARETRIALVVFVIDTARDRPSSRRVSARIAP